MQFLQNAQGSMPMDRRGQPLENVVIRASFDSIENHWSRDSDIARGSDRDVRTHPDSDYFPLHSAGGHIYYISSILHVSSSSYHHHTFPYHISYLHL